jgi:LmbE family N-acetylglucosaminyl deacetylase
MLNQTYVKKNVIIIASHPDDETLGCGGTILKHKKNGDSVTCVFVTNIFEEQGFSKEQISERQVEIEEVWKFYNFNKIYKLDYPTTTLESNTLSKLINDFSKIFNEIKPEIIYLPNSSDIHSDHRIVFEAAMSCTKTFRNPFIKRILMYETISETEFAFENPFSPNYFVDITEFLEKKLEIMQIYKSEVQKQPMPRSLENLKALAIFRGSTINKIFAEAFKLIKLIEE